MAIKPDHNAGELDEGEDAADELVDAGSDAPVLLDFLEEAFERVAFLVVGVAAKTTSKMGFWWVETVFR